MRLTAGRLVTVAMLLVGLAVLTLAGRLLPSAPSTQRPATTAAAASTAALVTRPAGDLDHRLRWSLWRRRQQARARTRHYRRQTNEP
jgi:hypothetical protein